MIEYIYRTSIDENVMEKTKEILNNGGLVAYPTDSSWGIGCSINSRRGIDRLRKLKGMQTRYMPTLICSSISQISEVGFLNNAYFKIIKQLTPGPFVFILNATGKIEKKVNMKRIEIGVRIPDHPVPCKIVNTIGSPIFSITASRNFAEFDYHADPDYGLESLFENGWELEHISLIDIILDTGETLDRVLSTVVDMTGETPEVIREGIGDTSRVI